MQPVSLKRVFFWALYFLGSLFLAFRFLLSLVPGGIHDLRMFLFYFAARRDPGQPSPRLLFVVQENYGLKKLGKRRSPKRNLPCIWLSYVCGISGLPFSSG
jgi:hypothetical protein